MFNQNLHEKELVAFPYIKPGHFVGWFVQLPNNSSSSEITCISCGAKGNVSILGRPLGLIFLSGCEEIRNNPELLVLSRGNALVPQSI